MNSQSSQTNIQDRGLLKLILTNPQLPIAAIGLIGTLAGLTIPWLLNEIKAAKLRSEGVPIKDSSQLQFAMAQNDAWTRNMDCFNEKSRASNWITLPNIRIAPVFCPGTGDILVQVKYLEQGFSRQFARWISSSDYRQQSSAQDIGSSMLGIKASYAAISRIDSERYFPTLMAKSDGFMIISQQRLSSSSITRLIRNGLGECFKESVSTYTGAITRVKYGSCPLVYIQIGNEKQRSVGEKLRNVLNDNGFAAPAIENVGNNVGPRPNIPARLQIRMAKKDLLHIQKLQKVLSEVGLGNASIVQLGDKVRAIEIWFGLTN